MRINVNEHLTITPLERRQVRAIVHQLGLRVRSGENSVDVHQQLASVVGKIGRIKRLHPGYAEHLRAQTREIQAVLDKLPFRTGACLPQLTFSPTGEVPHEPPF